MQTQLQMLSLINTYTFKHTYVYAQFSQFAIYITNAYLNKPKVILIKKTVKTYDKLKK